MGTDSTADTDERTFPRITVIFAEAWWHHRYGMNFCSAFWQDPVARTERDREQRRLLFERFGDVGLGERDPQPQPLAGNRYGHRFMSALWGCEIKYLTGQAPSAVALPDAWQRMASMRVPDLETSPVVRQILAEARLLEDRYGSCRAGINYGGPLNNAVSVLGEEILVACAVAPEMARRVLVEMGKAVLAVHDHVACHIDGIDHAATRAGGTGIGNCPVPMVSPKTYQEVVLPADLWFRDQFRGAFHLHHCGVFDRYAGGYRPLRPAALDLGWGTDLGAARRAYPEALFYAYIEPGAVQGRTQSEIDALVEGMVQEGGPGALFPGITVEAGPELSDETIRNLVTVPERVAA